MRLKTKICTIIEALCGVLLIVSMIMQKLWISAHQDKNIWIFDGNQFKVDSDWINVGFTAIVIAAIVGCVHIVNKNQLVQTIIIAVGILTLGVVLAVIFLMVVSQEDTRYKSFYRFYSDDETINILAEEWNDDSSSGDIFYVKNDNGSYSLAGSVTTDNGYTPIKNKQYSIEWDSDSFTYTFRMSSSVSDNDWYRQKIVVK